MSIKQYFTSEQFLWGLVIAAIAIATTSVGALVSWLSGATSGHATLLVILGAIAAALTPVGQGIVDAARAARGDVKSRDVVPTETVTVVPDPSVHLQ